MRYAVFSDIHANLQAWNAVLRDMRELEADVLVCLGDVIGYGPMPEQVLTAIRAETQNFVIGNHDAAAVGVYIDSDLFNPHAKDAIDWTRKQLSEDSKQFLAETPLTLETDDILFVHAEISEPSRFGYIADNHSAAENLDSNDHFLTFVGHTHHPIIFVRDENGETNELSDEDCQLQEGHRYIVNVGSVGEPRDPNDVRARYVIYDTDTREIYFRRIEFDHEAYRRDLAASGLGVVPFFLKVLDHSILVDQEALLSVDREMQTPVVWEPGNHSSTALAKRRLVTGASLTEYAGKPKPKPLPSQSKSPVKKIAFLVVVLLIFIVSGIFWTLQHNKRSLAQASQSESAPSALVDSPESSSEPIVSIEKETLPDAVTPAKSKAPSASLPAKEEPKPEPRSKPEVAPAPPAEPTPADILPTPTETEGPVVAYWRMDRDSEGDLLIDQLDKHSLRASSPGSAFEKVAPDPVPLSGDPNGSALTLGVWSEETPTGVFDLHSTSSFTFEGWIMIGGDTSPIRIATASNWQLDIKAGENADSSGSMRMRLGDDPAPIDVLAREIELHSPDPHHFAVVWAHEGPEPGSGMLRLFFDTKEVAAQSIPHRQVPTPSPTPFHIGEASNSKRVALDEVRLSRDSLNVQDFLTGPIDPVILFKTAFEKPGATATKDGGTLGGMTLFGKKGMTLEGLEGRLRLIVKENWGRADVFTTDSINMGGVGKGSYRIVWEAGSTGSKGSPSANKPTRGQHLTLREGKGMVRQLGDDTARTYVDFKGVSLQFIEERFQLVADTGNSDGASVILTSGTFSANHKSFHNGFTATLGIDGIGWILEIDGIKFVEGKSPEWQGTWKDKRISPVDLFTSEMHVGAGCSSARDQSKISLLGLSAEIVPIR